MISRALEERMSEQVTNEYGAHVLYLSMSAWFEAHEWSGFARWTRKHAMEELTHAHRFLDHVLDRDGAVALGDIPAPRARWNDPVEAFRDALEHERRVTAQIRDIHDIVRKEGAYDSESLLQWFADEQVEEERTLVELLARMERVEDDPTALEWLDHELGELAAA